MRKSPTQRHDGNPPVGQHTARAMYFHEVLAALKEEVAWISELEIHDKFEEVLRNERMRKRQALIDKAEGRS